MFFLLALLAALLLAPPALPQQALRRLSAPQAVTHPYDVVNAVIAPLGDRVVYVDTLGFGGLHSVPINGGAPVQLNDPRQSREVLPVFRLDANGQRVVPRPSA